MRLPAELRNKIYAFASDTIIVQIDNRLSHRAVSSRVVLLSVCKQTNSEATCDLQTFDALRLENYIGPFNLCQLLGLDICLKLHTIELHTSFLAEMMAEVYWGRATGEFCG